jgi:hypothetical protein
VTFNEVCDFVVDYEPTTRRARSSIVSKFPSAVCALSHLGREASIREVVSVQVRA